MNKMKDMTQKVVLLLCFLLGCSLTVRADVEVTLTIDEGQERTTGLMNAERNLAEVLTEINNAQHQNRDLNNGMFRMDDFARKSLSRLWATTPFYCDDDVVVERCWMFANGTMMVSHIPLIIKPRPGDDSFGDNTYQEAVVEFDRNGRIIDFRFSLSAQTGLSMTDCGVLEVEKAHIIQAQVERFRTAYNTKDLATIEQMFSDDALIITGTVVATRRLSDSQSQQFKVVYNRQNKQQYLDNLRKCFARNRWIDVKFSEIGSHGEQGGCAGITRSTIDPTRYGVRLRQSWKSSNYEDEGYLFLLFEFPKDGDPIIHVRTWQPEWVGRTKDNKGTHQQPDDDISTLGGFGL